MKRIIVAMIAVSTFALMATSAAAQQTTGNIQGRITDAQKAAVPGVTVTAKSASTGFTRSEVSDSEGVYRLNALPVGTYDVHAELAGHVEDGRWRHQRGKVRSGLREGGIRDRPGPATIARHVRGDEERPSTILLESVPDPAERPLPERPRAIANTLRWKAPVDRVQRGVVVGRQRRFAAWAGVDVLLLVLAGHAAVLPRLQRFNVRRAPGAERSRSDVEVRRPVALAPEDDVHPVA